MLPFDLRSLVSTYITYCDQTIEQQVILENSKNNQLGGEDQV